MNIVISGLTCSGKTTLSNEIRNNFIDTIIYREDDYMKNLINIPHTKNYYLMDLPSAYEVEEYKDDVLKLLNKGSSYYPNYDVNRNIRLNKDIKKELGRINIFEGLHTIEILKEIKESFKVFMDIDPLICLERRIKRDKELYNAKEEEIRKYFNEIILSIYKTHILPQKEYADFIIRGDDDKKCLLKKLQVY
jgi:uridine kinase